MSGETVAAKEGQGTSSHPTTPPSAATAPSGQWMAITIGITALFASTRFVVLSPFGLHPLSD
jgi:hypothetical protein